MLRSAIVATALALVAFTTTLAAHPAPFTYLDVRIQHNALDLSLVAHVFDVAHDVGIDRPERLFEPAVLTERGTQFASLLGERIRFAVDGRPTAASTWTIVEVLPDRQGIRLTSRVALSAAPGVIDLRAQLFPYDSAHQTFVNFHEDDGVVSQTILDATNQETRHYAGTAGGVWGATRVVVRDGFRHVFGSPEHVVLLAGLLLLGATYRQGLTIIGAFLAGHAVTLTLATLALVSPPPRLLDPAFALTVVYIGTDNLMSAGGKDVRHWMALAAGAIHGFGLAAAIRSLSLSRPALAWSVGAVHIGLGAAMFLVAAALLVAIGAVGARAPGGGRRLMVAGSVIVILAGAGWFIQRVFFPGATLPGSMARF
ncbi:MAG: HupE/UreJ family protein [Vicinamibacterales bacterium]